MRSHHADPGDGRNRAGHPPADRYRRCGFDLDSRSAAAVGEAGGYLGNIWVPCITWGGIVNQFGGFDFVNIDAEGASVDLFIDMLAKRIMPICVCVEIDDGRDREMNQAATAAGYRLVFSNAANALYEYR